MTAPRSFSRWSISPAGPSSPMSTRSPSAPSAPIATCPRACRSATRLAISSWKARSPSSASWRSSSPPIPCARPSARIRCGALSRTSRSTICRWWRKAGRRCRRFCVSTTSPGPPTRKIRSTASARFQQPSPFRARGFRRRRRLCARHPGGNGVRRRAIRGGGVYLFAAVIEHFLGHVRLDEQLQPVACAHPSAKGDSRPMAAASGTENLDVDALAHRGDARSRALSLRVLPGRAPACSGCTRTASVLGRFSNPQDEVARFASHNLGRFPASEIQDIDRPRQSRACASTSWG